METITKYIEAVKAVFEEGGLNAWLLLILFGIIIGFIIWVLIWLLFKKD